MGRINFSWPLFTAGFLLIISIIYTVYRLASLGAFSMVDENLPGPYEIKSQIDGPEALQVDHEAEVLYFISNTPCLNNPEMGAIYNLDLISGLQSELQQDSLADFQPHGLSFFKDDTGRYLFTNNHRLDGTHTIEIFKILDRNTLKHLQTIASAMLTSPNDLLAVSPNQFYVTIDGRAHDRNTRAWDTFLGRSTGSVLFYDGKQLKTVVDNLHFPNGISYNKDYNSLAIGETLAGNIVFYRIVDNHQLQYVDKYHIGVGIDNISFSHNSEKLYAAMHPNLLQLSKHMKNVDNLSGSQVVELNYLTKGLEVIFRDNGQLISGASSAVMHNDQLYIGAVCDNVLLMVSLDE